jgi:hypothetical protein
MEWITSSTHSPLIVCPPEFPNETEVAEYAVHVIAPESEVLAALPLTITVTLSGQVGRACAMPSTEVAISVMHEIFAV